MIPSHTFIYKTWIVSKVTSLLESRFLKFLNFMFNYKQNRQFFYCEGNPPYTFLKIPEILIWVTLQNSSGWMAACENNPASKKHGSSRREKDTAAGFG